MSCLSAVKVWLWLSALASLAGWLLSVFGELNVLGYLLFAACSALILWAARKCSGAAERRVRCAERVEGMVDPGAIRIGPGIRRRAGDSAPYLRGFRPRRFRRALPLCFAVLSLLIFIGGVLYPPNNHTALTYRIPRVLQWLFEHRWYWVHTPNARINDRACGIEWLSAPLLLFTRSDRLLFLLNFIPFLLLPGLIFSVWTRLGMRPRAAWHWMWLVPTGYTFLLQAGSIGNDTFPTIYALAAADFGLRAMQTRRFADLAYSVLAAALLTGAKASNLPLLLPWAILIIGFVCDASSSSNPPNLLTCFVRGLLALVKRDPVTLWVVLLVGGLISFLPTAILNATYCDDWSGLTMERSGMSMKNPFVGVWGNLLILVFDNGLFPFVPFARWWNTHALNLLPSHIVAPMVANFEEGFHLVGELPTEDWAGMGFGISLLIAASFIAGLVRSRRREEAEASDGRSTQYAIRNTFLRRILLLAPWLALLAYCMKSGMVTGARLISPYYPLLLPLLLISPAQSEIVRRRWWRALVGINFLLAFPVLILTPPRPLWPAQTVLSKVARSHPENSLIARALNVYSVAAHRSDPLAEVRRLLPAGLKTVGFMGSEDDIDISLWRPLFSRRVEYILVGDSAQYIREHHVEYIVVGGFNLALNHTKLEDWLARTGARLVASTTATLKVSEGPQDWYVVRLEPGS